MTGPELARLREKIESARDEVNDVYNLIDQYGEEIDMTELSDFTECALAAVAKFDKHVKKLVDAHEQKIMDRTEQRAD